MFLAWKKSENESKNGSKITKKTLPGHPTSASRKRHVANPKNESKKLKNPRFFHFFLARFGGRSNEQVYSVLFFTVFCEGERHDLSKTGGFFQLRAPPPQVNLNLSWLMPSGWSRPLHLRCGRIYEITYRIEVSVYWFSIHVEMRLLTRSTCDFGYAARNPSHTCTTTSDTGLCISIRSFRSAWDNS